jgi:surface antigen
MTTGGGMRRPAFLAALALAAALPGSGALGQARSGAASWPINTYLSDVDMARADAAIEAAAEGPPGTTVGFYNAASNVNGTVTAGDETSGVLSGGRGRRPTCRTFQVSAFLPPQYQSAWVLEPRWRDPFRINGPGSVERQIQTRPPSHPRFAWTACRGPDGQWTPPG